jgi:DNA-binding transcriptional LysR family regulator
MDLRQLESFREVVREGSFTGAARNLHMTQPAVSLHIKALEQGLGTKLLHRGNRGVRVTAAGAELLDAAERVLATLEDVRRRIAELAAPDHGTLLLACGDTVALHLLPPVLTAFGRAFPKAEVRIANHGSTEIIELVMRREADLGLVTRPAHLDEALQARTLHVEQLRLALPRRHPQADAKEIDWAALQDAPAVLLARRTETRGLIDRGLQKLGLGLQVVMESGNLEVVKAYVRSGMGISILPDLGITPADRKALVIRPMPAGFPDRRIALVRRRDRKPSLLVNELLKLVAEHFKGMLG